MYFHCRRHSCCLRPSVTRRLCKADVPFEFSVAQKTFPAGQYKIPADVKTHIVALYNADDRRVLFFAGAPILSPNGGDPGLEFVHLQDGTVYLSELWIDGSAGYRLSVPKRLRVMAANRPAARSHNNSIRPTTISEFTIPTRISWEH